mgnify:CR=1 FL=1
MHALLSAENGVIEDVHERIETEAQYRGLKGMELPDTVKQLVALADTKHEKASDL